MYPAGDMIAARQGTRQRRFALAVRARYPVWPHLTPGAARLLSKLVLVQVLRALAALAVATLHAQHEAGLLAGRLGVPYRGLDLPWIAGVDVFFVISGLIMVHASRGLFGMPGAWRPFLARRVARIVPLYWTVTGLYLAVAVLRPGLVSGGTPGPGAVAASLLFVPFARPDGTVQPVYSLGWTLNYEMLFYAAFAVALAWPARRALAGLALGLLALAGLGRALGPLPQPLGFWSDPIILDFGLGLGVGALHGRGLRLPGLARLGLAAAGLVVLGLDVGGWPRPLAYGVPAALLVAAAALGREESVARTGPGTRLGATLGDASYALYLVHPFVVRGLHEILWQTGLAGLAGPIGPAGLVALALPGAAAASLLVHWWFERPATALARGLLGARGPALTRA